MSLTKEDLSEIKKIVSSTEKRLESKIGKLDVKIDRKIDGLREELSDKLENTKHQILNTMDEKFQVFEDNISREISDLADINRAVITRTDEIDHRLRIVERKLGLVVK